MHDQVGVSSIMKRSIVPVPINYETYSADVGWVRRGSLRRNPTNPIFTKVGASRQPQRVGKTHQHRRLEGRLGFVGLRDKAANPTYMSCVTYFPGGERRKMQNLGDAHLPLYVTEHLFIKNARSRSINPRNRGTEFVGEPGSLRAYFECR